MNIVAFEKDVGDYIHRFIQISDAETRKKVKSDMVRLLKVIAETVFTKIITVDDFAAYVGELNKKPSFSYIHAYTQYWIAHNHPDKETALIETVVATNWDKYELKAVDTSPDFIEKQLGGNARVVLTAALLYPISFNLLAILGAK